MKTERLTLSTSAEFKEYLRQEARREGVSVSELVRARCEGRVSADEALLAELTSDLREAVRAAKSSVKRALAETNSVLSELRANRSDSAASLRSRRRKAATSSQ